MTQIAREREREGDISNSCYKVWKLNLTKFQESFNCQVIKVGNRKGRKTGKKRILIL